MSPDDFQGKKVVVMGLGLHGGGLSVAQWFFSKGAQVLVTDIKTREELKSSIDTLMQFCAGYRMANSHKTFYSIEYTLGEHREQDILQADLIIQNPAVPSTSPFIILAKEQRVRIENEASLFFSLTSKTPKIAVTGTRGKSTLVSLIYHIARAYDSKTLLAGNIRTITLFEIIDDVINKEQKGDFHPVILELSSWHLDQLGSSHISPHIAVITNIFEDHLNRYEGMPSYIEAKRNVYRYQTEADYTVLNFDNDGTRDLGKKEMNGQLFWYSHERKNIGNGTFVRENVKGEKEIIFRNNDDTQVVCDVADIVLPGTHGLEHCLGAITVSKLLGIANEIIRSQLMTFHGISDRLEKIAIIEGRVIYNDTTATTPEATIAALNTLSPRRLKNIVLIVGGADKHLDYRTLADAMNKVVHTVVLLSGTATPELGSALYSIKYKGKVEMANSMEEAVQKAWRHTRENDIMLLSPAAASYGMFIHEFDRGTQFRNAVARLSN